jgi:hypothetical protein
MEHQKMPLIDIAEQSVFGLSQTAKRLGVSLDTARRAADRGYLRTIWVLGRRMVPLGEIVRAETQGLGPGRKKRAATTK